MANGRLELWGGVEASLIRLAVGYFDQVNLTGHVDRESDIDMCCDLGISMLRYPVLWERVAPTGPDSADWSWSDARLKRIRDRGVTPIVGLLHHGCGPEYTDLLDDRFPEKFAEYAGAVARRYPWVTHYTPINEPLTTARFSGLYGWWYPHAVDARVFATILMNQMRATILAMREIRKITPQAQLIQTEDIGHTRSTPALKYQADFENNRRWLSLDLLTGGLALNGAMRDYLLWLGVPISSIDWFDDNQCPPDIVGVDYYPTSDRFLDDNTAAYPADLVGGNGIDAYADVELVRTSVGEIRTIRRVLNDVWKRYRLPLAVTEAHLGCEWREQVRWFAEAWNGAQDALDSGIDVRAVTAWALFGLYDWDSKLTLNRGHYEAGAFDVASANGPCATPLAAFLRDLSRSGFADHPCLSEAGWWRRPDRICYYPAPRRADSRVPLVNCA